MKSKKSQTSSSLPFPHLQAFLDTTRGQIAFGEITPRAAYTAIGKKMRGALDACADASVTERLESLNAALGNAVAEGVVIDEVLPLCQAHGAASVVGPRGRSACLSS